MEKEGPTYSQNLQARSWTIATKPVHLPKPSHSTYTRASTSSLANDENVKRDQETLRSARPPSGETHLIFSWNLEFSKTNILSSFHSIFSLKEPLETSFWVLSNDVLLYIILLYLQCMLIIYISLIFKISLLFNCLGCDIVFVLLKQLGS